MHQVVLPHRDLELLAVGRSPVRAAHQVAVLVRLQRAGRPHARGARGRRDQVDRAVGARRGAALERDGQRLIGHLQRVRLAVGRQRHRLADRELGGRVAFGRLHGPRWGLNGLALRLGRAWRHPVERGGRRRGRGPHRAVAGHHADGLQQVQPPRRGRVRLGAALRLARGELHAHIAPVFPAGLHDLGLAVDAQRVAADVQRRAVGRAPERARDVVAQAQRGGGGRPDVEAHGAPAALAPAGGLFLGQARLFLRQRGEVALDAGLVGEQVERGAAQLGGRRARARNRRGRGAARGRSSGLGCVRMRTGAPLLEEAEREIVGVALRLQRRALLLDRLAARQRHRRRAVLDARRGQLDGPHVAQARVGVAVDLQRAHVDCRRHAGERDVARAAGHLELALDAGAVRIDGGRDDARGLLRVRGGYARAREGRGRGRQRRRTRLPGP